MYMIYIYIYIYTHIHTYVYLKHEISHTQMKRHIYDNTKYTHTHTHYWCPEPETRNVSYTNEEIHT